MEYAILVVFKNCDCDVIVVKVPTRIEKTFYGIKNYLNTIRSDIEEIIDFKKFNGFPIKF